MSSTIRTRRLLRPVFLSIALVTTGIGIQAVPATVDLPVDRPEALQPLTALAVTCGTNPLFTGRLTASSGSTTAVSRITSGTVYGYISAVDRAWSCTASVRYSGITWNTTTTTGTFDWGNLINSTSVACNWGVGSTDYLKANSSSDCPDSDAEYAMAVGLTPQGVYHADVNHDGILDFSFAHSDCDTYHGAEPIKTGASFSTASTANRPDSSNCDPITLDSTGTTQTITYDSTAPTGSVTINAGAAYATSTASTLTLSATDAVAGLDAMRFSNDGTTWSAWETYATTKAWTLSTGDGTKTVRAQFRDLNGNISATYSDTVVLDTVNPTGSISIAGGATYATSTAVTLNLTYADAGSGPYQMQFQNAGGAWSGWQALAATKAWTLSTGDGTKTVNYQVKDNAGRISATYSDTIVLDTVNPTGSISIAAGATYATSTAVTLNLTYADTGSGPYQMQFQNESGAWSGWQAVAAMKAWTLSTGDGSKTVSYQVKDNAGRISTTYSDTILLDTINPTASLAINGGAASTSTLSVVLNVAASDATSGIASTSASNDNVTFTPVSGTSPAWTITNGNGTKTVWYRVVDGSGRTTIVSDTITLVIGPSVDFQAPDEGTTLLQSATSYVVMWLESGGAITTRALQRQHGAIVTSGNCAGVAWEDDGSAVASASPVDSTSLEDGFCYRWVETVTDDLGQSSTQTSGSVLIDLTVPSTTFTSPATSVRQNTTQATIAWTEADGGAGISGRIFQRERMLAPGDGGCQGFTWDDDSSASTTVISPVTQLGLVDGYCYRWVVTVIDQLGNTTYATSPPILIDTTAPSADFLFPNEGTVQTSGSVSTTVSWTEGGGSSAIASRSLQREKATVSGGTCGTTWTADGASVTDVSPQAILGLAADSCYRWLVTLTDGAGNTAVTTSGTVQLSPAIINSPIANGTMFAVETLSATTTLTSVTQVEFLVDGTVAATDTSPPYSGTLDTATLSNGQHQFAVRVTQSGGVTTTSQATTVTVANLSSSTARLAADFAAGALTIDSWALNGVYAALAPNALPSRYRSNTVGGSGDDQVLTQYLGHLSELQQSTRDAITAFLSQPFRADLYQPTSNLGVASGMSGCGLTRTTPAGNGYPSFTISYCQTAVASPHGIHFDIEWIPGATTTGNTVATDDSGATGGVAGNGIPDLVDRTSAVLEDAYAYYIGTLGYEAPNEPSQRIKVSMTAAGASGDMTSHEFGLGTIIINLNPLGGNGPRLLAYAAPHELFHVFQYHYKDVTDPPGFFERSFWYEATANWATHRWLTHYRQLIGDANFGPDNAWTGDTGAYLGSSWLELSAGSPVGEQRDYPVAFLAEYLDEQFPNANAVRRTWELIRNGQTAKESIVSFVNEQGGSGFAGFWPGYAQAAYEMSLSDPELAAWIIALEDYANPLRHPSGDPYYTGPDAYGDDRPHRQLATPPPGGVWPGEMDIGELGMGYVDIDPSINGGVAVVSVEVERPDGNVEARLIPFEFDDPADHTMGKHTCGPAIDLDFIGSYATATMNLAETCSTATLVLARTGPTGFNPFGSKVKWSIANGPGMISNGTIQLGVNPTGNLIMPGGVASTGTHDRSVGLRLLSTGFDGLSPDCDCEGWGVSNGTVSGWASRRLGGAHDLAVESFTQTGQSARSEVLAASGTFRVVHQFDPVPGTPSLYRITVSITNISAAQQTVLYRRTMDWDVEPTAFQEFVTVGVFGAAPPELVWTNNNGFATPDPLAPRPDLGATGFYQDFGPDDTGAMFDFNFGQLGPNETKTFQLFYGAASSEQQALGALQAVGASVYSLGESSNAGGPNLGQPTTFFFGYKP
jgi:hypothetical protein